MRTKERILGCALLLAAVAVGAREREMIVQVRETVLRETASFLGRPTATLSYGERVAAGEEQRGWVPARTENGRQGWVHASALTRGRRALRAGESAGTAAEREELALAGKGFSSDVEEAFRDRNARIDYTWVDRMETIIVDPAAMRSFLAEGGVRPSEGGAP